MASRRASSGGHLGCGRRMTECSPSGEKMFVIYSFILHHFRPPFGLRPARYRIDQCVGLMLPCPQGAPRRRY